MISIDGAMGEGGGQVLRSSLTLACCLAVPVRISNIRAGRNKPGLLRQHLTCVKAAQQICQAEVEGDFLGSSEVVFSPSKQGVRAGNYHFAIGSAGSTSLVLQTLLLPLCLADGESELLIEGGTHNGLSPSFDFIQLSYLPQLAKLGFQLAAKLEAYGFYPNGGGAIRVSIKRHKALQPLVLNARGPLLQASAVATSSRLAGQINSRELKCVGAALGWPKTALHSRHVESHGPGNILSLRLAYQQLTELFEVTGKKGLAAERVTELALEELERYTASSAVVGEYLADQLLLAMALAAGGSFVTLPASSHTLTNIAVIEQFLGKVIELRPEAADSYRITVQGKK